MAKCVVTDREADAIGGSVASSKNVTKDVKRRSDDAIGAVVESCADGPHTQTQLQGAGGVGADACSSEVPVRASTAAPPTDDAEVDKGPSREGESTDTGATHTCLTYYDYIDARWPWATEAAKVTHPRLKTISKRTTGEPETSTCSSVDRKTRDRDEETQDQTCIK